MKLMLLLLSCMLFLSGFSQSYPIGSLTVNWIDSARNNRQVAVKIFYPSMVAGVNASPALGSFPAIVFGHGFSMSYTSYQNIWEEFVPKGYIFVMVDMENGFTPNHESFGRDILFAGKVFKSKASQDNAFELYQTHNGKICFAGHSMGGGAAVLAASFEPGFPDALVGLAPAETSPSAIAAAASVTTSSVIFSGTSDAVTPPSNHHIPIYNALSSTCKTLVNIQGGAHCYFANPTISCDFGENVSGSNPSISRAAQQVITYSIAAPFWEVFLKSDNSQQATFTTALAQIGVFSTTNCSLTASIGQDETVSIQIFPNPSYTGEVKITHIPAEITTFGITDIIGRTTFYKRTSETITIENLQNGIYLLTIGNETYKILIAN